MQKDLKKLKTNNCRDCALHNKGGANAYGLCMWWDSPKEIPEKVYNKGCKLWRDDFMQLVIDKFDGKIIRRSYNDRRYNNIRRFRTKKQRR